MIIFKTHLITSVEVITAESLEELICYLNYIMFEILGASNELR